MQEMQVQSLGQEDPLLKEVTTILVFLPGKSHGQRSLLGYSPWSHKRVRHNLATNQQQSKAKLQGRSTPPKLKAGINLGTVF